MSVPTPRPTMKGVRPLLVLLLGLVAGCGETDSCEAEKRAATRQKIAGSLPFAEVVRLEEASSAFDRVVSEFAADLRRGDVEEGVQETFVATALDTPFPSEALAHERELEWIDRHAWESEPRGSESSGSRLVRDLERFLDHFSEIEDLRVKFSHAASHSDEGVLGGTLEIQLVGRDRDKRREWVRGQATFSARARSAERWQIERFRVDALQSIVANREFFNEVGGEAGLGVHNDRRVRFRRSGVLVTPLGAAAADLDRDGLLDLLVVDPTRNYLYLNRGDGTFRESSLAAALQHFGGRQPHVVAPLLLDFDNDGDLDLFISLANHAGQILLENRLLPEGKLVFRDISKQAGVNVPANGISAVAGDVNGDGLPDIYVTSYSESRAGRLATRPIGFTESVGPGVGTPNLLFVNAGDGTFREQAGLWGVSDGLRMSLAAQLADLDEDGDLDLIVSNDYGGGSQLYFNQAGQRFVPSDETRGFRDPGYGMGVRVGDYDNDGDLDVHITNMSSVAGKRLLGRLSEAGPSDQPWLHRALFQTGGNSLLENLGKGRFRRVSAAAAPLEAGWAWGGGFIDFDNDGWLDLHTPNGLLSGPNIGDT